jgi:hypothetical protein
MTSHFPGAFPLSFKPILVVVVFSLFRGVYSSSCSFVSRGVKVPAVNLALEEALAKLSPLPFTPFTGAALGGVIVTIGSAWLGLGVCVVSDPFKSVAPCGCLVSPVPCEAARFSPIGAVW